jgi:hypothetical protein
MVRDEDRDQALNAGAILLVEAAGARAVEIEDTDHAAGDDQRHRDAEHFDTFDFHARLQSGCFCR